MSDAVKFEKFELNAAGVRELLKGEAAKKICTDLAKAAASRCGNGYESDDYVGKNRVNARVYAKTAQAKRDNSENNTILKALR